jgi:hypothetical protein
MTTTFKMFNSRKDASLVGFSSENAKGLLDAICTNSETGYVKATTSGATVPAHSAEAVKAHLVKQGWTAV